MRALGAREAVPGPVPAGASPPTAGHPPATAHLAFGADDASGAADPHMAGAHAPLLADARPASNSHVASDGDDALAPAAFVSPEACSVVPPGAVRRLRRAARGRCCVRTGRHAPCCATSAHRRRVAGAGGRARARHASARRCGSPRHHVLCYEARQK
jgi:hypothetical protein